MSPKTSAALSLVLVMSIWGSTYAVTKSALAEVPPWLFAVMRFGIAVAILVPLAQAQGGPAVLPKPLPLVPLALMGLTGVALFFSLANLGLVYTTATEAALLQGSVPACTAALASLFAGERVGRLRALGIVVAAVGVALVVLLGQHAGEASDPLLGNLLVLGAVLAWSVYTILGRGLRHAPQLAVTTYSTLFGLALLLPLAGYELVARPPAAISPGTWLQAFYLGAVSVALGFLLYLRALRALDASQVANFVCLTPVSGAICGAVFLGERLAPGQLLGGLLVLIGVWLSTRTPQSGPPAGDAQTSVPRNHGLGGE